MRTVVAPHKKSKQIRSNKQALSEIASGLKALVDSSVRQHQMTMKQNEKENKGTRSFAKKNQKKTENTSFA